ncbi:MAG: hypothetical protein EF812_03055 [Methanosarcinales archaeon]|nr:MAG: hypothetical protein EF812_03055 [Methanosarcinales archaeon]
MITNLEKYKKDLTELIANGSWLAMAMHADFLVEDFHNSLKKELKDEKKVAEYITKLPSFENDYQAWYSESLVLLKQLLPDRVSDFTKLYEKSKTRRKEITYENYVIEDALQGLRVIRGGELVVGADAAIPRFRQQLNIIKAINKRFESSLFDIRQLVQADLFDSELEAAKELNTKGFLRGAGAIAGVVLEKHLLQVCDNHGVKITKRNPSISDYNDKLKEAGTYETSSWRKIQHLGDLRNLCDHKKKKEPKTEDVDVLIEGVDRIIKTIF